MSRSRRVSVSRIEWTGDRFIRGVKEFRKAYEAAENEFRKNNNPVAAYALLRDVEPWLREIWWSAENLNQVLHPEDAQIEIWR